MDLGMRLAIPITAVLLWGVFTLLTGPVFAFAWFGTWGYGAWLWAWLVFPLPFATLLLIEAWRRLRKPPKTRFPRD
jgi:hypothetical protein